MDDVRRNWLRKSNSVMAFIEDEIQADYDRKIIKKDFKQIYVNYCKSHGIKALSDKVIKITIENEVGGVSSQITKSDYAKSWVWEGIKFKNEVVEQAEQREQGISTYREFSVSSIRVKHPVLPVMPVPEDVN